MAKGSTNRQDKIFMMMTKEDNLLKIILSLSKILSRSGKDNTLLENLKIIVNGVIHRKQSKMVIEYQI